MFGRIAKVLTLERPQAVQVPGAQTFSKIREPDRLNATLQRRRPVLVRRWYLDWVSGKLACAWEVEGPDRPRDLGKWPVWPIQEPQLVCIAVLPRRDRRRWWGAPWRDGRAAPKELWPTPSDRRDGRERSKWLRSVA